MRKRWFGLILVIMSSTLWGVSGSVSQYLFDVSDISVSYVVSMRMLIAGILLIFISIYKGNKDKVINIWKSKTSRKHLIFYSIFGMLGVQFTYFTTISKSNAAIATLLQFLAPVFIIIFSLIKLKQKISLKEFVSLILALSGTFLLLTNGKTENLTISYEALFWGLLSAIALTFYTIYVKKLFKWPSSIIIGWSMIIGGIFLSFSIRDWGMITEFGKINILLAMIFIIFFGTLIAFYFFIEGLRYISPKEASLLNCTEPLSALITAILWLNVSFGFFQFIGAFFILGMIIVLSLGSKE